MNFKSLRKRSRGQTTLEYALVIAVIAVGVIILGKAIFAGKGGAADRLMGAAVNSAANTFTTDGTSGNN